MQSEQDIIDSLIVDFPLKHIASATAHYKAAVKAYQSSDWELSLLKSGKFVEAVIKSLLTHCNLPVPPGRTFKVGNAVNNLGQVVNVYDDVVRLLIPRSCVFIYDIVSNRGTRHDPDKIDPNKMDASVVMPTISWIFAEMIRFVSRGASSPEETMEIVENLTEKKYPHIEKIDGRLYINIPDIKPRNLGLLILHACYPNRITRAELSAAILRHGSESNATAIALTKLKNVVDDMDGNWKLRGIGRQEAEELLSKIEHR